MKCEIDTAVIHVLGGSELAIFDQPVGRSGWMIGRRQEERSGMRL